MNELLVIVGPTASGKTKLAVDLALCFNAEIVSADSMQIYKHLNIGTAKPAKEEMQGISHYMIDEIEPDDFYSVAKYKEKAIQYISDIQKRGKLPILVGGTGLYINSVIDNIEFLKYNADIEYRNKLLEIADNKGNEALMDMLLKVDEITAKKLHINDTKRIIRALEVYKLTGKTQAEQNELSKNTASPYNVTMLGLNFKDRKLLYERIDKRVDLMFEMGLLAEVKSLIAGGLSKTSTAMQAIGYKEIAQYFDGSISLNDAKEKIKQESRRYAKRQLTWFKRDDRIFWTEIDEYNDYSEILGGIKKYLCQRGFKKIY